MSTIQAILSREGCVDRHTLSAHKSSAADMLLAERGRIDSSHQMTDEILEYVHPSITLVTLELTAWVFILI